LASRIVLNAGVGVIAVSILAFFEEIGWRAWLLPRLAERMGERRAIITVAALWAFWHTPFVLSGILHIDGMPGAVATMILPLGQFGAGLVIGWLWTQTRSIWIVMLAHGALNNWGQYVFKFMRDLEEHQTLALTAGSVALTVLGTVLLAAMRRGSGQSRLSTTL
jgi:membrane protease YdiL (CAAX protease family)